MDIPRLRMPIPGEFAGASLKPVLSYGQPESNVSSPIPGEFAGASLKRRSSATLIGWAKSAWSHPRRIRRGLIEAQNSTRVEPKYYGGPAIPGEFAGASLKRATLVRRR